MIRVDLTKSSFWGFAPYEERKFVAFMTRLGVTLMPAQVKAGYLLFKDKYPAEGVKEIREEWGDSLIKNESQSLFWIWRNGNNVQVETGLREYFATQEGVTVIAASDIMWHNRKKMAYLATKLGEVVVVDGLYASTTIFYPDGREKILFDPWEKGAGIEEISQFFAKRTKIFGKIPGVEMNNFDLWDKVKAGTKNFNPADVLPVRTADTSKQKQLAQMAGCKPFSWADVTACDFGDRCLYDNEGATKFVPSQIFANDVKFRVVVRGEVTEGMGGYPMTPDQNYSDKTGTSSAEFTSEDEVVKAYYAISYAFARKRLPWPPPLQFHEEFKAAGYAIVV